MDTMAVITIPTAALSCSSFSASCPSSCFPFLPFSERGKGWSLFSRSKSVAGCSGSSGNIYVVHGLGLSNREERRSRSGRGPRLQPVCAGVSEPGSNEPGPSGRSGDEDAELDIEARFRLRTVDWRSFRARLVKNAAPTDPETVAAEDDDQQHWAHALVKPEKGCLLIAHPLAFGSRQTYFNQAVIFLFEHDEYGSSGFILNRPTIYELGQIPGFEKFKPEFTESRLYMGGDVGTNLIQVIHGIPELRDSKEVISGVYLGGSDAVKDSVKCGETLPNDYRWFVGYCGWRPGQLELEVEHGVWYLASSSKDVITNQCIRLKRPLWRQVLELMGGEYSAISRNAYGEA